VQQSLVFSKMPRLIWGPPSLLLNWYWGFFPMEKVSRMWSWPFTLYWTRSPVTHMSSSPGL